MYILMVGLNYEVTPIEMRERFSFPVSKLKEALLKLKEEKSILENVIISTCNRTEIYAVVDQLHTGKYYITQFLADEFNIPIAEFEEYLTIYEKDEAIKYLYQVTTGLKSMVLGETQILGQVRSAFLMSQELGATGQIFNELFKRVITFTRKMHSESEINDQSLSISNVVTKIIEEQFDRQFDKQIIVYGAGEMADLTVKQLTNSNYQSVTVVNRTFENAQKLAELYDIQAVRREMLTNLLPSIDIIISATSAESFVFFKKDFLNRHNKPLLLIDLGVPRNIAVDVVDIGDISLVNIDDIQHIVNCNRGLREQIALEINELLDREIANFKEWIVTLGVVPVIRALREKALHIQGETFASIERKIPHLSDRERGIINKHTKSIINQLLKEPIIQAKEMANQADLNDSLDLFVNIFGLKESLITGEEAEEKLNVL